MHKFWAKKNEINGGLYWLSLYQHLEDTREIAGLLWEHWLGDGQRKIIIDALDENAKDRGKDLLLFLAGIHDIGKATPAFQKKKNSNSSDLDIQLLEKLEQAGFNGISNLYLANIDKTPHNIAGQFLLSKYGVGDDLATIVGGHHGKPISSKQDITYNNAYLKNFYQSEDSQSEIYRKWENAQETIFLWALQSSNFYSVKDLPKIKQPAQVILSGLLIMADWIASNDEFFPLWELAKENLTATEKKQRLADGFAKWRRTQVWNPDYESDYKDIYKRRFGFEPRNVQSIFSDAISTTNQPGIFILEAPMGIGKTEAALVAAEQLAYKTGRNGLFFGLPTQATSNGIFPRIRNWLENICSEQQENLGLRLSHGKAYMNETFKDLARGVDIDGYESVADGSIVINEWFSGRKTSSLDDFVVGTVDQFLLVALKQKHLALRHLGFSKKVVVIDEVHAYDAYMNQYLLQAIKWMGAYRVPVIVLSATLPAQKRIDLIKNYLVGMGKWNNRERDRLQNELNSSAYPLITYNDDDKIYQIKDFPKFINKKVAVKRLDEDMLLGTVKDAIKDGAIVGIIVNTVQKAQTLAKIFSDNLGEDFAKEKLILLHSAFIATERVEKEDILLKIIGNNAQRPFGKIVIGTQVIEQSLDIDFDIMISDLAPMDLLLQRMGRLHRHNITRPEKYKNPIFYVLGTRETYEFAKGSSLVYGDYLLARTQDYLPEDIFLPEDISKLVQQVYNFSVDSKINDYDKNLQERFKQKHAEKIVEKEIKAKTYRIADPIWKKTMVHGENLIGWLNNELPNNKSDSFDEKANAQVRDIEPTIEVIALKKIGSGYGVFGKDKDISGEISDIKIGKFIAQNTITIPRNLSRYYNIDRVIAYLEKYKLANLCEWQRSTWLKNSLAIIFDENNEFLIDNFKLVYDEQYGIFLKGVE